jgi:hypothetical protein
MPYPVGIEATTFSNMTFNSFSIRVGSELAEPWPDSNGDAIISYPSMIHDQRNSHGSELDNPAVQLTGLG